MLLKVDKLEAMLGDLVRSTGIMYNFNLSEGEKKDVDRCFLMLRDMAGYVRDKLSHPEEKESKKNVVKDDDTDVIAEEQNFEFVEEVDIDALKEISEEKSVVSEKKKSKLYSTSIGVEERKKAKRVKVENKKSTIRTTMKSIEDVNDVPNPNAGQNVFKSDWMDPKNLLFDINGDRLSDYLSPVNDDPSLATCLACRTSFSISMQGVGQVYAHARGGQHKASIARLR